MDLFINKSKKDLKEELNKEISSGNTQKVKNILDYATENKIILNLNEKDEDGYNSLLYATYCNNIKIVHLLIDYANKNKIILNLNEKNYCGWYPLLRATYCSNIEIVKL